MTYRLNLGDENLARLFDAGCLKPTIKQHLMVQAES